MKKQENVVFADFSRVVNNKFKDMVKGKAYLVQITSDELWELYMKSFPEGTNPMFREKRAYDCNTCRAFIKNLGSVVTIKPDGTLDTIWNVEIGGYYKDVAENMHKEISKRLIASSLFVNEGGYGKEATHSVNKEGKSETWTHFHGKLPNTLVGNAGAKKGDEAGNIQVFSRGLEEITLDALDAVIELTAQNTLYRGTEFINSVKKFRECKVKYLELTDEQAKNVFYYNNVSNAGSRIRNTAIGTLLQDLSSGVDLEDAVKAYERVVAPTNYKRPTALITPKMVENAQKTLDELNLNDSLARRHAVLEDISVNDVLFVDRSASKVMKNGIADLLAKDVKKSKHSFDKAEEIGIEDFIKNVLPTVESLEAFVDNKCTSNFVNILAPVNENAEGIFKWGNNFSWSYNGDITDSMKQNVKNAGGKVDGFLRFSIQWNEDGSSNGNDLDAHCVEPGGYEIYYGNRGRKSHCGGDLDVDIMNPGTKVAVENIIYESNNKLQDGVYSFFVYNFRGTSGRDFTAEVEFNGVIHSYTYTGKTHGTMPVADVTVKNKEIVGIVHHLPTAETSKEVYGLSTQQFHKVDIVTLSPNFWNEKEIGNKHYMFILNGCKNPNPTRGFYNEFLDSRLDEHRKVFEILAARLKAESTDKQLAGLGFSSTQRNELIVKASGTVTRLLKIKF